MIARPVCFAALILAAATAGAAEYRLFDGRCDAGPVEVVLTTDDEAFSLGRDTSATISLMAPAGVLLPDVEELRGRFQGFSLAEGYAREPIPQADGRTETSVRWRLRADPAAARLRLAPFAIEARNSAGLAVASFVSSPAIFPLSPLPEAEGSIEYAPRKFFVWPTLRQATMWMLEALVAAALVFLIIWLLRRIHRAVRVRMMSPGERALHELSELLSRKLAEKGLFKDYYIELTHVVRRYIERAYGIRAPRLTTDEFLEKIRADARFESSGSALAGFFRSADMIKFAGVAATGEMAAEAAGAARRYVEDDAARLAVEAAVKGGVRR